MSRNREYNASNPHQGDYKKVLCVCSAGLLRSPTTAVVLSQEPYNYNTRAVGIDISHALIPIDEVLLGWADEIVCMTDEQASRLSIMLYEQGLTTSIVLTCLDIADSYAYRDIQLIELISTRYLEKSCSGLCKEPGAD